MRSKLLVRVMLGFVFAAFVVRGQNAANDESGRILALETAWNHALEGKDTAALEMLLSKNMVALDSDGVLMTRAGFLAGIKAPDYQPAQVVTEKVNVQMFGETAVVSGVYREKSNESGKTVVHRASCVDSTAVTIPSKP